MSRGPIDVLEVSSSNHLPSCQDDFLGCLLDVVHRQIEQPVIARVGHHIFGCGSPTLPPVTRRYFDADILHRKRAAQRNLDLIRLQSQ